MPIRYIIIIERSDNVEKKDINSIACKISGDELENATK